MSLHFRTYAVPLQSSVLPLQILLFPHSLYKKSRNGRSQCRTLETDGRGGTHRWGW